MALDKDEIEHTFYRFLADELSISDLEKWIYSTAELEEFLGASQYLELISFNFQPRAANYELSKLIYQFISKAAFDNWQIKRLLYNLIDKTQDTVVVFSEIYHMYCQGYYFLGNVGVQYVMGVDEIPTLTEKNNWDENEFFRLRNTLDQYIEPLKNEISLLLQGLEAGEIKITGENKYFVSPKLSEKLKDFSDPPYVQSTKQSTQPKKSWWKFWQN